VIKIVLQIIKKLLMFHEGQELIFKKFNKIKISLKIQPKKTFKK